MRFYMDMKTIGSNIRKYRMERGMKQERLAELTNLSPNYIGMLERTDKIPSLSTFIRIINALEVSADMVLCDVLNERYTIKNSLIFDKISQLNENEQQHIYAVVTTLLEYAKK